MIAAQSQHQLCHCLLWSVIFAQAPRESHLSMSQHVLGDSNLQSGGQHAAHVVYRERDSRGGQG